MRVYSLFLALLIFTSCNNSAIFLLDDAKDVKRYIKSDRLKKKKQPSYFVQYEGVTYHLENPSIKYIKKDILLSLSGTLREEDVKFKEVRDSMQYFPKKRIKNKEYTEQYVFMISEDFDEEIHLNSELNTVKIDYPVKRYKYYNKTRTLAYIGGGVLASVAGLLIFLYISFGGF